MKKYLVLYLFLVSANALWAQQNGSCCAASATESFSQLASDPVFIKSHPIPLPYRYDGDRGKPIQFKTPDGTDAWGWEIKSAKPSHNYLLVIHEWWGLNDYIKKESEAYWKALGNVNVVALDLYDKKVATTREEAGKYMQSVQTERAIAIIRGALAYVGTDARVYTVGWCFGGGWSLQASLLAGSQAAGCVMYYGMPEKQIDKLRNLHCDVLGLFANKDQWINPAVVDAFAENMKKADKTLIVKRYDADHAFANPSNPSFDKDAKEDAYQQALAFLRARMK